MPKEGTHLYFADLVCEKLLEQETKALINKYRKHYFLGAVFPDVFYYHPSKSVIDQSDYLHCKNGNLSTQIIYTLVKSLLADGKLKSESKVFILGVLSHFALDIKFHPIVYYFSGNYYDKDEVRRSEAIYLHCHLENSLDVQLNHDFKAFKDLDLVALKDLAGLGDFLAELDLTWSDLLRSYKRLKFFNYIFSKKVFFLLFRLLRQVGLPINKKYQALFRNNLEIDGRKMRSDFNYQDLINGQRMKGSTTNKFIEAQEMWNKMLLGLECCEKHLKEDCLEGFWKGEGLDTGVAGVGVDKITFFDKSIF